MFCLITGSIIVFKNIVEEEIQEENIEEYVTNEVTME